MSENDDYEFKRPKNILQIRKFQDEVDSSDIEFQEPYSKDGMNFKKSSEKVEIHDSKSKPQDLKHVSGLKKSLDKSDIFNQSCIQYIVKVLVFKDITFQISYFHFTL